MESGSLRSRPESATTLLYRAAGSPQMPGAADGTCALCGSTGTGVLFAAWVKDTFMDYDKLKGGEIICQACQLCADDGSTILQTKLGRDKPQRMRNYSHFVVDGEWLAYHKGQKRETLAALRAGAQVAVISLSGQKHILFRARPGWWQVEESAMLPDLTSLTRLLPHIETLLVGFSKGEIESGQFAQHRIIRFGVAQWRELESKIKHARRSQVFQLAVWLAQVEEADGTTIRESETNPGADLARDTQRVQDKVRAEHLDTVREQREERGPYDAPGKVRQPSLF